MQPCCRLLNRRPRKPGDEVELFWWLEQNGRTVAELSRPKPDVELLMSTNQTPALWVKFMKSSTSGSVKVVSMSLDRPIRSFRVL